MNKALGVAVLLLGALAVSLAMNNPTTGTLVGPHVIAKGALTGQTAPIPTTTIVTPTRDGLFRLTAYGTMTKFDGDSSSEWDYRVNWTDDAGRGFVTGQYFGRGADLGPFAWSGVGAHGVTWTFEAKAGTPITYAVTQSGPPDQSAYSLYYTLERLE